MDLLAWQLSLTAIPITQAEIAAHALVPMLKLDPGCFAYPLLQGPIAIMIMELYMIVQVLLLEAKMLMPA
jgi:hypothetical protein